MTPDEWLLLLFLFAFVLSLILGLVVSPIFTIMAGVVGIFLAIHAFAITANTSIVGIIAGISLLMIVLGVIEKPNRT